MDETLDFKVIEFNKESKKIVVSHSKVYQDAQYAEKSAASAEKKSQEKTTKKGCEEDQRYHGKTTLGDLDVLANLKDDMEKSEI
jgi:small subunit ribosomal protein S1